MSQFDLTSQTCTQFLLESAVDTFPTALVLLGFWKAARQHAPVNWTEGKLQKRLARLVPAILVPWFAYRLDGRTPFPEVPEEYQ